MNKNMMMTRDMDTGLILRFLMVKKISKRLREEFNNGIKAMMMRQISMMSSSNL
ncbi:hypothetical protein MKW92_021961, partial [Papaver armeniacum]